MILSPFVQASQTCFIHRKSKVSLLSLTPSRPLPFPAPATVPSGRHLHECHPTTTEAPWNFRVAWGGSDVYPGLSRVVRRGAGAWGSHPFPARPPRPALVTGLASGPRIWRRAGISRITVHWDLAPSPSCWAQNSRPALPSRCARSPASFWRRAVPGVERSQLQ